MASSGAVALMMFHTMERELFWRLVGEHGQQPGPMRWVIALWLWLESVGHHDFVRRVAVLPAPVVLRFVDEALACLARLPRRRGARRAERRLAALAAAGDADPALRFLPAPTRSSPSPSRASPTSTRTATRSWRASATCTGTSAASSSTTASPPPSPPPTTTTTPKPPRSSPRRARRARRHTTTTAAAADVPPVPPPRRPHGPDAAAAAAGGRAEPDGLAMVPGAAAGAAAAAAAAAAPAARLHPIAGGLPLAVHHLLPRLPDQTGRHHQLLQLVNQTKPRSNTFFSIDLSP